MALTNKHQQFSDQNHLLWRRKVAALCSLSSFLKPQKISTPLQGISHIRLYFHRLFYLEEGIALIMTLWIMVLLIAIATEFTHATRTEINTTKNFKEEIASYYLAQAGINLAITEILQDAEFHALDEEGEIVFGRKSFKENVQDTENFAVKGLEENASDRANVVNLISSENRKEINLGTGGFSYSIKDVNGKPNLNIIPRRTIIKILELSGMGAGSLRDTIADSIMDWRDKDDLHRFNGAEDDYYLTLSPPYECKNDFFDSVEELIWVKGMTEEILYGTENTKKNKKSGQEFLGIYDMLTVENIEFINPNTVDENLLEIFYPPDEAEVILLARMQNGKYDNSKSSHFIVESTGFLNDSPIKRTIKATFEKIGHGNQSLILSKYWNDNKIK
tara:strand:- start:5479 stop:6648 length:1170 start_codon:yes stop_codon:yes gene_type:complete